MEILSVDTFHSPTFIRTPQTVGCADYNHFRISRPHMDSTKGFIIKLEISPLGERHSNVYVSSALDSNPCSRLAVKAFIVLANH